MMFIEFFILGSTSPIISLYLKNDLGFSGSSIGLIMAGSALSALISPFISAFIADRLISAERLLSIFHAAAAVVLFALFKSSAFVPVLLLYLLYWLLAGPTVALTTAITFHHAPQAAKQFGGIRLWGTLGWIGAAWAYRLLIRSPDSPGDLRNALLLGIAGSVVLMLFALTIPAGVPRQKKPIVLLPKDSLHVILNPQILLFCIIAVFVAVADRMYVYGAAPYLKSLGVQEKNIMPLLSIGQVPEIFGLALLGWFIMRFGIKKALLTGALLEIFRFSFFMNAVSGTALIAAISVHGLTFAFFFTTASILLDNRSTRESRSGVHQYFGLFTGGMANLIGNTGSGFIYEKSGVSLADPSSFVIFWTVAMLLSAAGFIGILFFFREERHGGTATQSTPPPTLK